MGSPREWSALTSPPVLDAVGRFYRARLEGRRVIGVYARLPTSADEAATASRGDSFIRDWTSHPQALAPTRARIRRAARQFGHCRVVVLILTFDVAVSRRIRDLLVGEGAGAVAAGEGASSVVVAPLTLEDDDGSGGALPPASVEYVIPEGGFPPLAPPASVGSGRSCR